MKPRKAKPSRKRVALLLGWYIHGIHLGVARYAKEAGWILDSPTTTTTGPLGNWWGDGIICIQAGNPDLIGFVKSRKVPVVSLSPIKPGEFHVPQVLPDNVAIGRMAGIHLISRGLKDIGFTCLPAHNPTARERSDALRAAVEEKGGRFHPLGHLDGSLLKDLRSCPKPIGIMTENDYHAGKLLQACQDCNLKVPEDVAIIGVDNDIVCVETTEVPLSSVDSNTEEHAYIAAQTLDRFMNGEKWNGRPILVVPRGVVERQSTAVIAVDHKPTALAMRYIWDHYREHIRLSQVAKLAGLCRPRLQDAFYKHIGRSMTEEITRLRLLEAKRLLAETDTKVSAIASEVGFANGPHLTRVFRKNVRCTPEQFRRHEKHPLSPSPCSGQAHRRERLGQAISVLVPRRSP